jgi:hypothetical protein
MCRALLTEGAPNLPATMSFDSVAMSCLVTSLAIFLPSRGLNTPAGDGAIPSERQRENIVALAGWAAELASGEANENGTYDSADLTFVLSRLDQHAPSRIEIELGWAESEAQRIVSANLERIERLAHELMSRKELTSAAEILDIIEGRPPA